ncbi:5,6-dimethylbenzimidazole synthase BluB / nicotinate-nucleotide--dimethylbenzimidazole phosphoribosyltransferase CobT multi-domain protein [Leptospira broomii serovar Hurstbridge str. 5399]|uniref:Nicotinate-nucleotide--dimethylbenzimidazole phosphoribosyltransferase n=2 Tax=Leptospira broomii TaxID=301541 RepID=T0GJ08_9LEPT|nr:5,6-dimethylbenzimidazole synthase BluB / nicotinate-nucleotide--dimethylbenzimidazole phosphoribosyltransferase CobT multi-domain protein [Leptospira broomii serovar Hurstbridge str. 5399]
MGFMNSNADPSSEAWQEDFTDSEKASVYKAIYSRRDIRAYTSNPIDEDIIHKLLDAAHHAPSVGFMQPWNFVIIQDMSIRRKIYDHFIEVNERAANLYRDDRKVKYSSLKLQGILDSPVNILFTCDRNRDGENVLGRSTNKDTDIYSTCLAVQNFWLAARAEGLGAGWMSILESEFIRELLEIPEHILPIAYMTLGTPVWVPKEPMLESVGWKHRENLSDLVFKDKWGIKPSSNSMTRDISKETHTISPQERLDSLTKPKHSLGFIEECIIKLATIQRKQFPASEKKAIFLFAGDHGIASEGISAYNSDVTAQMMYMYIAGGAAINSITRKNQIDLVLFDMGINHDFNNAPGMKHLKIRKGTRNFLEEPAMTQEEVVLAFESGKDAVKKIGTKYDMIGLGEMGIGNTTASTAIASIILNKDPLTLTGAGTGIGNSTILKKIEIIRKGILGHKSRTSNEWEALVCFGGYEIAAMVGAIEEAYSLGIPVVLDGMITSVAALIAYRRNPEIVSILIAGHLSKEPTHKFILNELGLRPVLDLNLSLGEGSGSALAMGILDTGCALFREMKTFEEANIRFAENEDARL